MNDWWTSLTSVQQIFWGISIVFTVLFLIQFLMSIIGADLEADGDLDLEHSDFHGVNVEGDFTVFSVRSLIAFFTFFGWAGVLVLGEGGGLYLALGAAVFSGFLAMFIVAYMMFWFSKMTQGGNVDLNTALLSTGEVYFPIPGEKKGSGKIHILIGNSYREVDAVTEGPAIPTGKKVRVTEVIDEKLIKVEPVPEIFEK